MEFGLIGERLPHSFSKEIHARCADYDYRLTELAPDEIDGFLKAKNFKAINVTIPYKQMVIPYLDEIDTSARADLSGYTDEDEVSRYARTAMEWAVSEGIISGMTADTLAPAGVASRAQIATIISRFVPKYLW
jgi:hypothetical protein